MTGQQRKTYVKQNKDDSVKLYIQRTKHIDTMIVYLSSKEMDDFKGMFQNPDCHQLLAVVSAMHHQGVNKTLHNWALGFAESFHLVTP